MEATSLGLPPGLRAARVAGVAGVAAYQDDGRGSVLECGVVVSSPLPVGAAGHIAAAIQAAKPGYRPSSPDFWGWPGRPATRTRYWADPLGPGLYGVMLREGAGPIGLQVDSHSVLVR